VWIMCWFSRIQEMAYCKESRDGRVHVHLSKLVFCLRGSVGVIGFKLNHLSFLYYCFYLHPSHIDDLTSILHNIGYNLNIAFICSLNFLTKVET
jgi:hypothetical protein